MTAKIITISLQNPEKYRQYAYSTGRKLSSLVRLSLDKFIEEESKQGVSHE